jgi:hypothetical protein
MARTQRNTRATSEQAAQLGQSSQLDPEHQEARTPARSTRTRQTTTTLTATGTKRRLRSAKDNGSPLQVLDAEPKRTVKGKGKASSRATSRALSQSENESEDGAQAEAHAQAHGNTQGYAQARTRGHNQGSTQGHNQASSQGHDQNLTQGPTRGHTQGSALPELKAIAEVEAQEEVHGDMGVEAQAVVQYSGEGRSPAGHRPAAPQSSRSGKTPYGPYPDWMHKIDPPDYDQHIKAYEDRFGREPSNADRGREIFFQIRMRDQFLYLFSGVGPNDDFNEWFDDIWRQIAIQVYMNEVDPRQAQVDELEPQVEYLQAHIAELESRLKPENEALRAENEALRARHKALLARNGELENELLPRYYDSISTTGQVIGIDLSTAGKHTDDDTDADADTDVPDVPPTEPTRKPSVAVKPSVVASRYNPQGSKEKIELLEQLEKRVNPGIEPEEVDTSPQSPEALDNDTPMAETPKQQGMFTSLRRLFNTISPFSRSRAEPPPSSAQQPDSPVFQPALTPKTEFALSLSPTPAPVGERSGTSKTSKTKNHRKHLQTVAKAVASSVQDAAEKEKAAIWAEQAFAKLIKDSVGNKRKRADDGVNVAVLKRLERGVKVADLTTMNKPWASGYGMDDDLYDLSDSDDAPAWAVLNDMVLEQEEANQQPAKKVKSNHDVDMGEITSLNDSFGSPTNERPGNVFNSGGKSVSLSDLRPRPSTIGSPMFNMADARTGPTTPTTHQQDGNLFAELDQQLPNQLTGAGNGNGGSFGVPDSPSDEEDSDDEAQGDANLWTQQPPPAPTPAHASLPNAPAETPSAPAAPLAPIDVQRAKISKHTPAKPSRLREMHVPSPSLRSDAGNESIMPPIDVPDEDRDGSSINEMELEDIPDEDVVQFNDFISSKEGQAYFEGASDWSAPEEVVEAY